MRIGHQAENLGDAALVVISSAIPESNPELRAARAAGLPVLARAEMLARVMAHAPRHRGRRHARQDDDLLDDRPRAVPGRPRPHVPGRRRAQRHRLQRRRGAGRVARGRGRRERRQPALPAPRGGHRDQRRARSPRQLRLPGRRARRCSAASSRCCRPTGCSCWSRAAAARDWPSTRGRPSSWSGIGAGDLQRRRAQRRRPRQRVRRARGRRGARPR